MDHLKQQIIQYSNGERTDFVDGSNYYHSQDKVNEIDLSKVLYEKEENNVLWNVSADKPITSHRRVTGKFIVFGKRMVRKLLRWYVSKPFEHQTGFNGSVTRSINEISNVLTSMKAKIEELEKDKVNQEKYIEKLEQSLIENQTKLEHCIMEAKSNNEKYSDYVSSLQRTCDELGQDIISTRESVWKGMAPRMDEINGKVHYLESQYRSDINFLNQRIRKLQKAQRSALTSSLNEDSEVNLNEIDSINEDKSAVDFDYLWFENRFRGSLKDIKNRQRAYIPYFENQDNVLDIGCGRGEFVELLLENKISAKGIDTNDEMVEYCADLGLPVIKEDAIRYLNSVEDCSIGGIFLGQVIEHMPFDAIMKLTSLAYNKLRPGCYLIMETPNPLTLAIFNRSFYLDPTHVKPVHPLTMQFLIESIGFRENSIKYSGPVEEGHRIPALQSNNEYIQNVTEFNESIERVNDILFGYQDYAIIARK